MSRNLANTMHRTTVDLPTDLVERTQRLVESGAARSRNSIITAALEEYLDQAEREAIDAQFSHMATDDAYQRLMLSIADEFTDSDWESLREGDHATQ